MVVIVTHRNDLTADLVVLELAERRANFLRFNTDDYPGNATLYWSPDETHIVVRDRVLDAAAVDAVWWRRPVFPPLSWDRSEAEAIWAGGEAQAALEGFWRLTEAHWVNRPEANAAADSKPEQLIRATRFGFDVPSTLVTNDASAVRAFADATGPIVCKPIREGVVPTDDGEELFFTSVVETDDLRALDELGPEPYLFQAVWLLTAPANCGGNSTVGVRQVPINAQGRFHAELQLGSPGAPRGSATVDGQFVRTERNGVAARTTIRSRPKFPGRALCDTGTFLVRAVSPKHGRQGAGQPARNALFVGMTQQFSSRILVKQPMLALLSPNGTQVKRFIASTNVRCKSGRRFGSTFRIRDIAIQNGSFNGVTGNRTPVPGTDRARTIVLNAKGTFAPRRLAGTWRVREVETDPYTTTDDCDTGDLDYFAARVR